MTLGLCPAGRVATAKRSSGFQVSKQPVRSALLPSDTIVLPASMLGLHSRVPSRRFLRRNESGKAVDGERPLTSPAAASAVGDSWELQWQRVACYEEGRPRKKHQAFPHDAGSCGAGCSFQGAQGLLALFSLWIRTQ